MDRRSAVRALIGAGFVVGSLASTESFANRPVLDRWSYELAAVLVCGAVVCACLVVAALRPGKRDDTTATLSWALMIWGAGYWLTGLERPARRMRVLELDLVGSTHPVGAVTDWVAMVLVGLALVGWGWRRGARETLLLALAAGVALLSLEGIARAGALLAPRVTGFPTKSERIWYDRNVELNELGFRDADTASAAPRRMLVVGDSYAFGFGIADTDDRFGELLARELSRSGSSWRAYNASGPGTHTRQHLEFLERAASLAPDLVVLLYVLNDGEYLGTQPWSPLVSAPRGLLDRVHPARLAHTNSYLFQEILIRTRGAGEAGYDPYLDPAALEEHLDDVQDFVDFARSVGAEVEVVIFDHRATAIESFRARHAALTAALADRPIPACTLTPIFEGEDFTSLTVNRFDIHPNERANRLAVRAARDCGLGGFARSIPSGLPE